MHKFEKRRVEIPKDLNVNSHWSVFSKTVFATFEPSIAQYTQMKQAFYAGVMSMLVMNLLVAELGDDAAVLKLEELRGECEGFFERQGGK
jgi:hypothetical protein